jgi:Ankyrin repeats (3 copies)
MPKNIEKNIELLVNSIKENNLSAFKKLLQQEININEPYGGLTPLHYCCIYGRENLLKILLSKPDLDINARTGKKDTPLDLCIQNDQLNCAKLILRAGSTIHTNQYVEDYFTVLGGAFTPEANHHFFDWMALLLTYNYPINPFALTGPTNKPMPFPWLDWHLGCHQNKTELFIAMKKLEKPERELAMKNAMDKYTHLGKIFHHKNGFFSPDITRKECTLYQIKQEYDHLQKPDHTTGDSLQEGTKFPRTPFGT